MTDLKENEMTDLKENEMTKDELIRQGQELIFGRQV